MNMDKIILLLIDTNLKIYNRTLKLNLKF